MERESTRRGLWRLVAATLVLAFLSAVTLHTRPALADLATDHAPVASMSADCCDGGGAMVGTGGHCAAPSLCWSLASETAVSLARASTHHRPPHVAGVLDALFDSPPAMPPRAVA